MDYPRWDLGHRWSQRDEVGRWILAETKKVANFLWRTWKRGVLCLLVLASLPFLCPVLFVSLFVGLVVLVPVVCGATGYYFLFHKSPSLSITKWYGSRKAPPGAGSRSPEPRISEEKFVVYEDANRQRRASVEASDIGGQGTEEPDSFSEARLEDEVVAEDTEAKEVPEVSPRSKDSEHGIEGTGSGPSLRSASDGVREGRELLFSTPLAEQEIQPEQPNGEERLASRAIWGDSRGETSEVALKSKVIDAPGSEPHREGLTADESADKDSIKDEVIDEKLAFLTTSPTREHANLLESFQVTTDDNKKGEEKDEEEVQKEAEEDKVVAPHGNEREEKEVSTPVVLSRKQSEETEAVEEEAEEDKVVAPHGYEREEKEVTTPVVISRKQSEATEAVEEEAEENKEIDDSRIGGRNDRSESEVYGVEEEEDKVVAPHGHERGEGKEDSTPVTMSSRELAEEEPPVKECAAADSAPEHLDGFEEEAEEDKVSGHNGHESGLEKKDSTPEVSSSKELAGEVLPLQDCPADSVSELQLPSGEHQKQVASKEAAEEEAEEDKVIGIDVSGIGEAGTDLFSSRVSTGGVIPSQGSVAERQPSGEHQKFDGENDAVGEDAEADKILGQEIDDSGIGEERSDKSVPEVFAEREFAEKDAPVQEHEGTHHFSEDTVPSEEAVVSTPFPPPTSMDEAYAESEPVADAAPAREWREESEDALSSPAFVNTAQLKKPGDEAQEESTPRAFSSMTEPASSASTTETSTHAADPTGQEKGVESTNEEQSPDRTPLPEQGKKEATQESTSESSPGMPGNQALGLISDPPSSPTQSTTSMDEGDAESMRALGAAPAREIDDSGIGEERSDKSVPEAFAEREFAEKDAPVQEHEGTHHFSESTVPSEEAVGSTPVPLSTSMDEVHAESEPVADAAPARELREESEDALSSPAFVNTAQLKKPGDEAQEESTPRAVSSMTEPASSASTTETSTHAADPTGQEKGVESTNEEQSPDRTPLPEQGKKEATQESTSESSPGMPGNQALGLISDPPSSPTQFTTSMDEGDAESMRALGAAPARELSEESEDAPESPASANKAQVRQPGDEAKDIPSEGSVNVAHLKPNITQCEETTLDEGNQELDSTAKYASPRFRRQRRLSFSEVGDGVQEEVDSGVLHPEAHSKDHRPNHEQRSVTTLSSSNYAWPSESSARGMLPEESLADKATSTAQSEEPKSAQPGGRTDLPSGYSTLSPNHEESTEDLGSCRTRWEEESGPGGLLPSAPSTEPRSLDARSMCNPLYEFSTPSPFHQESRVEGEQFAFTSLPNYTRSTKRHSAPEILRTHTWTADSVLCPPHDRFRDSKKAKYTDWSHVEAPGKMWNPELPARSYSASCVESADPYLGEFEGLLQYWRARDKAAAHSLDSSPKESPRTPPSPAEVAHQIREEINTIQKIIGHEVPLQHSLWKDVETLSQIVGMELPYMGDVSDLTKARQGLDLLRIVVGIKWDEE